MAVLKRISPYLLDVRRIVSYNETQFFLALGAAKRVGKISDDGSLSVTAELSGFVYDVAVYGSTVFAVVGTPGNVEKALQVYDTDLTLRSTTELYYYGDYGWVVKLGSIVLAPDEDGVTGFTQSGYALTKVVTVQSPFRVGQCGALGSDWVLYSQDDARAALLTLTEVNPGSDGECVALFEAEYDYDVGEWVVGAAQLICASEATTTNEWIQSGSTAKYFKTLTSTVACGNAGACAAQTPPATPSAPTFDPVPAPRVYKCLWTFVCTYDPSEGTWGSVTYGGFNCAAEATDWTMTGDCDALIYVDSGTKCNEFEECSGEPDVGDYPNQPDFIPEGCVAPSSCYWLFESTYDPDASSWGPVLYAGIYCTEPLTPDQWALGGCLAQYAKASSESCYELGDCTVLPEVGDYPDPYSGPPDFCPPSGP